MFYHMTESLCSDQSYSENHILECSWRDLLCPRKNPSGHLIMSRGADTVILFMLSIHLWACLMQLDHKNMFTFTENVSVKNKHLMFFCGAISAIRRSQWGQSEFHPSPEENPHEPFRDENAHYRRHVCPSKTEWHLCKWGPKQPSLKGATKSYIQKNTN